MDAGGTYASANASNSTQAQYLGKVSLHHNSGNAAINVISCDIVFNEPVTPDGIKIDDLLDMSELECWATVEGDGLKTTTGYAWFGTWPSKQLSLGTLEEPATEPVVITGNLIASLEPAANDYQNLWSIDTELQLGDLLYNDRTVTYTTVPEVLIGA